MHVRKRAILTLGLLTLGLACSNNECPEIDTLDPAPVTDLRVLELGTTYVQLGWTATGDDGTSGTASEYDIRYGGSFPEDSTWGNAALCDSVPVPAAAGTPQTCRLHSLSPATTYYFVMKVSDEAGNWSDFSNVASSVTVPYPDSIQPASVTDLAVSDEQMTSIALRWTATGDDSLTGTASVYDIRYSTTPLNGSSWPSADQCPAEPVPQPAGSQEA